MRIGKMRLKTKKLFGVVVPDLPSNWTLVPLAAGLLVYFVTSFGDFGALGVVFKNIVGPFLIVVGSGLYILNEVGVV